MPNAVSAGVLAELVEAAIKVASERGSMVADVPIGHIAAEAGMSRSTLLRRLGGTRQALDDAVRASGVDPGGQPVRQRALAAAAELISEVGIGQVTLEAIASRANCSVDSLYVMIGNRDALLAAVFREYSPLIDMDQALLLDVARNADLPATVEHMYRSFAAALLREPRLTPALIAEALSRPGSPVLSSILELNSPHLFAPLRLWLEREVHEGRIRDLPPMILAVQFLTPLLTYTTLQPALSTLGEGDVGDACTLFAEIFVRGVART